MKINISLTIITCLTFVTSILFGQTKQVNPDTLVKRLGETYMKNKQAVGLSIGVYNNGTNYFYNFGTIEKGKAKQPTQNTVYEIGSITKAFVSLVLANAVIEKRVKFDDDIRNYLDGTYPNLEYNKKPVTLLELSNTTSGIPDWLPKFTKEITDASPDSTSYRIERVYRGYTEKDIFRALHKVVLDTVPGFKSRHSNGAAVLLSYILAKVYKTPIENLVSKYVLKPNKMTNTFFVASKTNSKLLAKGYNSAGNVMPYSTTTFLKGAGGMSSSTSDLVKFIRLQLDTTNRAINFSHQKTFNAGWCDIGLTWLIYKHENGNRQFWVDGSTYGFTAYVIFYPEINSGIVVLSNEADPSSSDKISDIADGIFNFISKK